jgi:exodeoxyribonuclease VII small subunit
MTTKKAQSYQSLRQQLDKVVAELQQPDVDVDKAIELHKQATALLVELELQLDKTKITIEQLTHIAE